MFQDKYNAVSDEPTVLTKQQVANSVKYLRAAFNEAANKYRQTHRNIVTHFLRNKKTLKRLIPDGADTTLYDAQIEFAYIINEIEMGARDYAVFEIKKANELIESLNNS